MMEGPLSTEEINGAVENKLELSIDSVIEDHIGSFGRSQWLHVFLVSLAWIFDSQSTLVTIFSDAQPSSWKCVSSEECRGISENINGVCGLKAGTWEWVGGNRGSTIAEWSLVCDRKFLAAIPASLFFLGSLLGICLFPFSFNSTYFLDNKLLFVIKWAKPIQTAIYHPQLRCETGPIIIPDRNTGHSVELDDLIRRSRLLLFLKKIIIVFKDDF